MASRQEILNKILNSESVPQCYPATVVSVSGNTATVNAWDDLEVEGVGLMAFSGSKEGVLVIPKVGSSVVVVAIDNDISRAVIVKYSEIDRVEVKISDTEVMVSKEGFSATYGSAAVEVRRDQISIAQDTASVSLSGQKVEVSAGGVSLKSLLSDLFTALSTFTVATTTGPALPAPNSITEIQQLTVKLNQLLK